MNQLFNIIQDADPMEHDFLVVSVNGSGAPGNLNRAVMKRAGYPEQELPHESDLRSGYFLLNRPKHKPILFIVVNPEASVGEELQHNLYRGLLTYLSEIAGKRVWLPLLGTGAGRMAYGESFSIMTRVIESLVGETTTEPPQFTISIPGTKEGLMLLKEFGIETRELPTENLSVEEATPGYWLIKLGAAWKEEDLHAGESVFFRPKDAEGAAVDEAIPQPMRPGDHVLLFMAGVRPHPESYEGYPGDYLWGEAVVEEQIEQTIDLGVRLKLVRAFFQTIPLHRFQELVPNRDNLFGPYTPYETVHPVPEETYHAILALEEQPFRNPLLPFYLTEGNHRATQDQLDFEADIDAFAAVIRQEAVKPPLAIGLFGNWGSGKSFFMEKLEERIADKERWNHPEYVENVVPVRFNSWHYSDANLWASMITHIFKSLNDYATNAEAPAEAIKAIYAELNVTKEQLAQAQKALDEKDAEAKTLAAQKTLVEQELDEKRRTLGFWKTGDIMRLVFDDPFVQEDIRLLNEQFESADLTANLAEIRKRRDELSGTAVQLRAAWTEAKKYSRGGWLWVWLTVIGVGVGCFIISLLFREKVQGIINEITVPIAMLATLLTSIWSKLSPHLKKVRSFYQSLQGLASRVEAKKGKMETEREALVSGLQQSIAALESEKAALGLQRNEIEERKKALETELTNIGSGKLLANFISGKSADDAYLRQLGIISWIREDFEQLNRHFEKQRELHKQSGKGEKPQLQIDRIVLYIDDLDRCNEDVVVKVLEAIHLLLAFPLFVVVVGVDPRWLNNALTEKYKLLFGAKNARNETDREKDEDESPVRGAATSYDYLEKIFQIPFALKPMTKDGREKLIRYLAEDRLTPAAAMEIGQKNSDEKGDAVAESTTQESNAASADDSNGTSNTVETIPDTSTQSKTVESADVQEVKKPDNPKEKLTISAEELAYMQQLSPLFAGTPRTVNRYVNIYRIIKAHGGLQVAGPYERDEFLPILFLLAVVVGFPEDADNFLSRINAAGDAQKCGDFIDGCGIEPLRTKALEAMGALGEMHMRYLKRNLPLVARFSFRTLMRKLS